MFITTKPPVDAVFTIIYRDFSCNYANRYQPDLNYSNLKHHLLSLLIKVENMSLEQFWWIWNRERWTQYVLDRSDKYLNQIISFLVRNTSFSCDRCCGPIYDFYFLIDDYRSGGGVFACH